MDDDVRKVTTVRLSPKERRQAEELAILWGGTVKPLALGEVLREALGRSHAAELGGPTAPAGRRKKKTEG